jgi:hypothetical protein
MREESLLSLPGITLLPRRGEVEVTTNEVEVIGVADDVMRGLLKRKNGSIPHMKSNTYGGILRMKPSCPHLVLFSQVSHTGGSGRGVGIQRSRVSH